MAAWEEKVYNLREVASDKSYTSLLKSIEIKVKKYIKLRKLI